MHQVAKFGIGPKRPSPQTGGFAPDWTIGKLFGAVIWPLLGRSYDTRYGVVIEKDHVAVLGNIDCFAILDCECFGMFNPKKRTAGQFHQEWSE